MEVLSDLRQLDAALGASRRRARLEIEGYADPDGPDDLNHRLSQARADRVRALLDTDAFAHIDVSARGLGRVPLRKNGAEEHGQHRRVSFRVHLSDERPSGERRP